MLGTVYAKNERGEVRYFDYDREAAIAFSGATQDRDPRWSRAKDWKWKAQHYSSGPDEPSFRQKVLWITEESA